jgi:DNA mismatch repair protein MutH
MKILTRANAIENLKKYKGQDLISFAKKYNITSFETGKQNKGWKGLVLERLAGLDNSTSRAPNGLTFELKSVSCIVKDNSLAAKETMAITMINQQELRDKSFFESHCWNKLKSIVFCAVEWSSKNAKTAKLLNITSFDFEKDDTLILEIKKDYDFIRKKLIENGFASLTGKDGKWIQARTKGTGHGSTTRAFYARKELVNRILQGNNK